MRNLIIIVMMMVSGVLFSANAQTRTIHGVVLDAENNEPLVGATVMPVGGGQGVATDADGKFTLTVPAKVKTASFSYVGYTSQTVALKNDMKVYLASSSTDLSDVVVVAYGTATKESLTGSVAVVKSDDIESRPVTNVTTALEGNAPGVRVSSSTMAGPGGAPSILIRGINTVNGTNAPIYVVDGSIYNGSISDINPDDVESMSVLKDAASCALYGSKGANGVILITTRKAKKVGKIDVTLKVSQGLYERGLPFYDTTNSNEWMETKLLSQANGQFSIPGQSLTYPEILTNQINNFYDNNQAWNIYGDVPSSQIFNSEGKVVMNPLSGYDDLNWWDVISQTGYRQEYNLSAAGASDKYNIYASVGYLKSQGYLVNTDYERFTSRFNFNAQPLSYLRFGVNASVSWKTSDDSKSDSDNLSATTNPFQYTYRAPVLPYYDHDVATGAILRQPDGAPVWNQTSGFTVYESNIGYLMRAEDSKNTRLSANASIYGTAVIPYGFELTFRGDMMRYKSSDVEFDSPYIGSARDTGRLSVYDYTMATHNFQQALTWDHDYGIHHVDVLMSHENYQYDYKYNYQKAQGMVFWDGARELTNFTDNEGYGASHTQRRTESYLARGRYNFDQKYFAEASIRRDGTSRFSRKARWGTFWSLGASWILSKEKFLSNVEWLNYLKFRASYGTAGSDAAAGSYEYWSLYAQRSARVDGQLVMYPSQLGNDEAKWESVSTLDLAFEGALFNNRLNFTLGFFVKRNADLLYNVTMPTSAGGSWSGSNWSILQNIGTMQNVGWEIGFNGDIIRTKDFKWSASIDASFIKNKLVKLPATGNQWYTTTALLEGKSRYEHYMYTWAGVDMATGRSLYEINPDSHTFEKINEETGLYEFNQQMWDDNLKAADENGRLVQIGDRYYTTETTYASRQLQGTSLPTVFGSFGTNLKWKGISLGLLFTYSLGGKTYDSQYASLMSSGDSKTTNYHKDIFNSWTAAPANLDMNDPSSRINKDINPQVNGYYSTYDNGTSSRWLISSSYLQMKSLTLGYDFPRKWVNAIRFQGLNVSMLIENLFTVAARNGIVPNYNYSGGQGSYYVPSRTITFNVTARF